MISFLDLKTLNNQMQTELEAAALRVITLWLVYFRGKK
jgi:hypothetical protein